MIDTEDFLRRIIGEPTSENLLIFADYLEEQGDERAMHAKSVAQTVGSKELIQFMRLFTGEPKLVIDQGGSIFADYSHCLNFTDDESSRLEYRESAFRSFTVHPTGSKEIPISFQCTGDEAAELFEETNNIFMLVVDSWNADDGSVQARLVPNNGTIRFQDARISLLAQTTNEQGDHVLNPEMDYYGNPLPPNSPE